MNSLTFSRRLRRGLSTTEIVCGLSALSLGVVLGAYYLGLDLHVAAYRALDDNEVIENLPPEMQEAIPVPASELAKQLTPEQIEANLRNELYALRLEVARLNRLANGSTDGEDAISQLESPETATQREATVIYWSSLREISIEVNQLLDSTQELLSEKNVWEVLEVRKRAYRYGAESVEALPTAEVDPQAALLAKNMRSRYDRASELYAQAMLAWESHELGGRVGQVDVALENGRLQLENEAKLLGESSQRLRNVLGRRYSVDFGPISP